MITRYFVMIMLEKHIFNPSSIYISSEDLVMKTKKKCCKKYKKKGKACKKCPLNHA